MHPLLEPHPSLKDSILEAAWLQAEGQWDVDSRLELFGGLGPLSLSLSLSLHPYICIYI